MKISCKGKTQIICNSIRVKSEEMPRGNMVLSFVAPVIMKLLQEKVKDTASKPYCEEFQALDFCRDSHQELMLLDKLTDIDE